LIQIIKDAIEFYRHNFNLICAVLLPVFIPEMFITLYLDIFVISAQTSTFLRGLPLAISVVASAIYGAGLIVLFNSILNRHGLTPSQCLQNGLILFPLFISVEILIMILTTVGFFFLIIPGIMIAVRLSLSQFYLVLTNTTPINALKSSSDMTKGYTIAIFNTLAVAAMPMLIVMILYMINLPSEGYSNLILSITIQIFFQFYAVFFSIVLFRIFCLLNSETPLRKDTFDTE
jgi:hypothetical protein